MRLYLNWIEGAATDRNAGGSNPSRRTRLIVLCLLFDWFLVGDMRYFSVGKIFFGRSNVRSMDLFEPVILCKPKNTKDKFTMALQQKIYNV